MRTQNPQAAALLACHPLAVQEREALRDEVVEYSRDPMRFLPKGNKRVVLGLVTSKTGDLENKDDIEKRIEEAAQFAPLDQFCLSPQCGFASTEEGNVLTEEAQWKKLELIVEIARETWGY